MRTVRGGRAARSGARREVTAEGYPVGADQGEAGVRRMALGRRRVAVLFFSAPEGAEPSREAEAKRRAFEARARLDAGETWSDVARSGDPLLVSPPDVLLPLAKLHDVLGATATRAVLALKEGETSDPLQGADGFRIVHLMEARAGETPDFKDVRGEVLAEYRRRQEDLRVRRLLEKRRAESEILVAKTQ